MATFYYHFRYDKEENDFFGIVESVSGYIIFKMEDTDEMRTMIKNKYMTHVDDCQGLEIYLKSKRLIEDYDELEFLGVR